MPKRNIHEFIEAKRQWTEPLSPANTALGFRGWYSRGYLPHFDSAGLIQMVTYRLDDAMPAARRQEWSALLAIDDEPTRRTKIEAYLDAGHGSCWLRRPEIAIVVQENLLHFDGSRYKLLAWVIMPNHVHALIEVAQTPLTLIVQGWKSYTAKRINELLHRTGTLWQPDYFDRYIRDDGHFAQAVRYIENNPTKAKLVKTPADWAFGSAALRIVTQDIGSP